MGQGRGKPPLVYLSQLVHFVVIYFFLFCIVNFPISTLVFPHPDVLGHQTPRDMLIILPELGEALGLYNESMMFKTPWA
jgi:hypothetical protein